MPSGIKQRDSPGKIHMLVLWKKNTTWKETENATKHTAEVGRLHKPSWHSILVTTPCLGAGRITTLFKIVKRYNNSGATVLFNVAVGQEFTCTLSIAFWLFDKFLTISCWNCGPFPQTELEEVSQVSRPPYMFIFSVLPWNFLLDRGQGFLMINQLLLTMGHFATILTVFLDSLTIWGPICNQALTSWLMSWDVASNISTSFSIFMMLSILWTNEFRSSKALW